MTKEARRSLQDLIDNEERTSALLGRMHEGFWIASTQSGAILDANQAMCDMLGYSHDELLRLTIAALESEEPRATIERRIKDVIRDNTLHYETRFCRKDGAMLDVEVSITYLSKQDVLFGYHRDISTRKQAENNLRRLNRELHAIRDCNQTLIRAEDEQTLLNAICSIICDKAGYQMVWVGYAEHDELKTVRPVAIAGEAVDYIQNAVIRWDDSEYGHGPTGASIRSGQTVYIQNFFTDPRIGQWRDNALKRGFRSSIALPLRDSNAITFGSLNIYSNRINAFTADELRLLEDLASDLAFGITILRERARQKQSDRALLNSEARFRAVVENSSEAILFGNRDATVTYRSPATSRIIGFNDEERLGQNGIELAHPDDLTIVQQFWTQMLADPMRIHKVEYRAQHKNGGWIWVEVTARNLLGHPDIDQVVLSIRDITERKIHEQELESIATLSAAMRKAPTRTDMLPVIVQQIVNLLHFEAVTIEVIEPESGDAVVEAGYGPWSSLLGVHQKKGDGLNGIIRQTLQPYVTQDLCAESAIADQAWMVGNMHGAAGVPMVAREKLMGFIWTGRQNEIHANEVRLLSAIADIAANAISRATLHEQTQKQAADLTQAYEATLEGLAHALELRDRETEGHTRRVVSRTLELARRMNVGDKKLEDIRRGALLHDIGKMGIPDSILLKPGKLNDEEWAVMRQHPVYALNMLKQINFLQPALTIPYYHHEKWDGSGYPLGLKGNDIPLEARIFAIVDVWDALTNDRPYRPAWTETQALDYINEQRGKHFDPDVVEAFIADI